MLNHDVGQTVLVVLSVLGALTALPFVMARMESTLPDPPRPAPHRLASTAPLAGEEPVE